MAIKWEGGGMEQPVVQAFERLNRHPRLNDGSDTFEYDIKRYQYPKMRKK